MVPGLVLLIFQGRGTGGAEVEVEVVAVAAVEAEVAVLYDWRGVLAPVLSLLELRREKVNGCPGVDAEGDGDLAAEIDM
jgi:hypothetical protein